MGIHIKLMRDVMMKTLKNRINLDPALRKVKKSKIQKINLTMALPIFMFLGIGIAMSIILFAIEFATNANFLSVIQFT